MKHHLIILFFFVVGLHSYSTAQNLVPNPSFEDTVRCPRASIGYNITDAQFWFSPIGTSSDHYHVCSNSFHQTNSDPPRGVPTNTGGYQHPRTGDAYAGIIPQTSVAHSLNHDWNEYISVELKDTLVVGQEYEFVMYLNSADKAKYFTESLGVLFTKERILPTQYRWFINLEPQIKNPSGNVISDRENWVEFKQNFVADSNYVFLCIGGFLDMYESKYYRVIFNNDRRWNFPYLYIDDVSLTPVRTICYGDSVTLKSQNDSIFSWRESTNPNLELSNDSVLVVSPLINTIYYNIDGLDTSRFIVKVFDNSTFSLGNDTNLCEGTSIYLNAGYSNASYLWQDGSTNYNYEVKEAGKYWVEITNNCGTISDTINVTTNTINIDLGGDIVLCEREEITISPSPYLPNAEYLWFNFSSDSVYRVRPWDNYEGKLWVRVSRNNLCGSDTINIKYNLHTEGNILGNDTAICQGDTLILDASTLISEYSWSTGETSSTIEVIDEGEYSVNVKNKCFDDNDKIYVRVKPMPYFDLGDTTFICTNTTKELRLTTIPGATFWWDNFTYNDVRVINKGGEYSATSHFESCYYYDTIYVIEEECNIELIVPNVFSPNNDGMNDLFEIKSENVEEIDVLIFDKWGNEVFKTTDKNIFWDGQNLQGKSCSNGVYFYIIKASNYRMSKTLNGSVSLYR